ncbi:ribosomal protein S18-alanine N-acetyltransferase [Thiocystis violacea]|uniref:ribosomal protein S18-alanine N-acetyltransferase n=1 Tax=Thiocystis violacea TaxID=13725 RepID=UPI0019081AA4|nr:ribosomal protein S18-alanine N-acetyltransferase [Thiocystis violacea]MBK1718577.1 ribosomal-protein-alanine N-acetyltransferase [Thiocystis violacea]
MNAPSASQGLMLRPMREEDLAAVIEVERAAYPFPWTDEIFQDCLRVGYGCWVGEIDAAIVAHGIMSVAVGECHIFNLCVHPDWQQRGLGRQMLRHLLALALKRKAETAFLEVRASNQGARALYVSEGFCEIGVRRNYYPTRKGREDATLFALEIQASESSNQGADRDRPAASLG